jgi:RHS repeat-associated protein
VDQPGDYVIQLIVNDGYSNSSAATVLISTIHSTPVANAGPPQTVLGAATVNLNGSGSIDSANLPLIYTWTLLTKPAGSSASLSNAHAVSPKFVADLTGEYVAQLVVNDSQISSAPATVLITAVLPPLVNAGTNRTIPSPNTFTLQGTVTSQNNPAGTVTARWTQLSGPAMSFTDPSNPTTTAYFNTAGSYVLQLTGTDGNLQTSSTVTITAVVGNQPPVVNAGPDQTIQLPTSTVTLNGAVTDKSVPVSSLTISWTTVLGPGPVTFSNPTQPVSQATFSAAGTYVLRLAASDSQLIGSADVRITVLPVAPVNQPPVVNAGPNQTLVLPSNVSTLPLNPTLVPISTGFNNPVGIDYHQPTNKVVTSVNYFYGSPHNFELVAADGTRSQFSKISGLTDEVYIAAARDEGGGMSQGGFRAGELFTGSGVPGVIVRISPDGNVVQNPWVTLPGEGGLLRGQLYIDRSGVFNGDLIVLTTAGNVWRVTSAGVPTLLANIRTPIAEGLLVVPNDALRYGPWAGKIIVGGESQTLLFAIDAQGNVTTFDLGIPSESIKLIPANENFFGVDFGGSTLWGIPASELTGFAGDILIAEEFSGLLWVIHWNGTNFETLKIAHVTEWEGTTFAPAGIVQVASTSATTVLNGSVTDNDGLPVGGTLTSLWSQVSGPGTATFASPNTPVTSVTFSEPGTYVLRLTASDSQLTSSSDVTVNVLANHAPVVNAGSEQQIALPSSVTLNGRVTDDGLPIGGQLNSFWTKVIGPGKVTFSNPGFNVADGFSPTANPSGAWTFGWESARGAAFTPYTAAGQLSGLPGWFRNNPATTGAPGYYPLAVFNNTGVPSTVGTATLSDGALLLHPGPNGENSVVRWTAPKAGAFLVQGQFVGLDSTTSDVAVLLNSSTTLLNGNINGHSFGVPFTFVKNLNAGDTLDFTVGFGNDNNFSGDSTGLNVVITPAGSTSTIASFSLPGDYLLRLVGYDSELFGSGDVRVRVSPTCVAPPAGLVGWWPGDGDPRDLANGNTGVTQGGLTYGPGEVGESFVFDGSTGRVIVPQSTALNVQNITLDAWIYPNISNAYQPVLEYIQPSRGAGVLFGINYSVTSNGVAPGVLVADLIDVNGTNHPFSTGGSVVPLQQWSHVALTYDSASGNAVLYLNGASVATANFGTLKLQTALQFNIGYRAPYFPEVFFSGRIDEAQVFNRALSPAEIKALALAGDAGTCKPTGPQPPVVSAGLDQTITLPVNTVNLSGTASDPAGAPLTLAWSEVSGPGRVSFANPAAAATSASFSGSGTYQLRLTANNGQLTASRDVTITVNPNPTLPPVVNAGANQTITLPVNTVNLTGTVTDSSHNPLTIVWSEVSGPAGVSFANAASPSTTATFPGAGTYILLLTASDGQLSSSSDVQITVNPANTNTPPTVSAGPPQSINLPQTSVTLNGAVTYNGPANGTRTIAWSVVSAPSGGTVTFSAPNAAVTQATFSVVGSYVLQLTATDSSLTSTASTSVTLGPALGPPPTVSISLPDGIQITQPTVITGSVSNGGYKLEYALLDDAVSTPNFTVFASGTGPVTQGSLGTLDPTLLLNGTYSVRLTATDANGQFTTTSGSVFVTRNMKVGAFSVAFNDLSVPVAGFPIQITRSYDNRDKGNGDFGVGWRLAIGNVRVQKNHNLGLAWQETVIYSGGFPQYCVQPTVPTTVTVTFPDGKVYSFQSSLAQQCQLDAPITVGTLSFVQLPGPATTAGATLTPLDGGALLIGGDIPGAVSLIGYDGNIYNPTAFLLKTAQGVTYTLDQAHGVTKVADLNGNSLSIGANGITHSTGKSVAINRNVQGNITSISDPNGNVLSYSYDGNGNLGTFTDRAGNSTQFAYDFNHNLTGITLPNGQQGLTNSYDPASGRLVGTTDALGVSTTFTHDVAHQTETVTDRNGNPTTYVYDADGNIVQTKDALGHVSSATYDSSDNKLSETNALGKTTSYTNDLFGDRLSEVDPLHHETTYSYNSLQQVLAVTDALGHTTANTYDGNGNLLTSKDPLGDVTTNQYSANGLLRQTTDALHNNTSFGYDGSGNLTSQTDALNHVSTYTYDANGNRKTQGVTRTKSDGTQETLTTTYTYDGNNRLTKTTYPDGTFTQVQYNALGQQSATIDAKNHTTSYTYDLDGHLTQTSYPDGASESATYDKNGNRLTTTDRGGHTTTFAYDALNRLTSTTYADNSATSTTYDAIGQVLTSKEANGHVAAYAYDAAGRRTSVTDAQNHVTTFSYDDAENQVAVTDANAHTTQYVYDPANRRTKVLYPDSNFETTAYDALGRVLGRTDANGLTTQYGYDALGRLTSVTDALHQVTSYFYDEVGNRITQTDANMHATSYAYDQRGRRIQRKLPLGQTESYAYDNNGNLSSRTDFNGHTTTYSYDNLNRLLAKNADAFFVANHLGAASVSFTYTPQGQRATMSDASGASTYTYDARNRLITKATPEGTLRYTYDAAGDVKTIQSSNTNGANLTYAYDALNRLATVTDANGATGYSYDNVGNLAGFTYPNGVAHAYTYDARNRLTNLAAAKGTTQIAGYGYLLDASGHRLSVTELSGRTVNYGYDNLYRLTGEVIAADTNGVNGSVGYGYDAVGNRLQKVSTLPGFPGATSSYNANDQLATDTYDANGNTTASTGLSYAYDFENRLVQQAGLTIVYDGDGNRVSKTGSSGTTQYLVEELNPTGYAQVVDELQNGSVARTYTWGLELIAQTRAQPSPSPSLVNYYVFDGHGSVRALTDATGAVTDTYDYDAFGNLLHSTGTTPNNYRYSGEQFDPDLNLYYNRARYLNTSTGRFWSMDSYEGDSQSPRSLHKYLYTANDPVNRLDRNGHDYSLVSVAVAGTIVGVLAGATIGAIRGGVNGAIEGAAIGALTGGPAAVLIVTSGLALAAVSGISAGAGVLATSFGALELALAFGASDYARARTRRERAAAVVAIAFAIIAFGAGAAAVGSGGAGSTLADTDVPSGTLSLRGAVPDDLLQPQGWKLGQMIARAGLKGQPDAPQQLMVAFRQLIQTATQDGTFVRGNVFTNVDNPGATIYRVGDEYLLVDQSGLPISYVPQGEPGWGIVEKYQALGGK